MKSKEKISDFSVIINDGKIILLQDYLFCYDRRLNGKYGYINQPNKEVIRLKYKIKEYFIIK
jgi:hypothetical protein